MCAWKRKTKIAATTIKPQRASNGLTKEMRLVFGHEIDNLSVAHNLNLNQNELILMEFGWANIFGMRLVAMYEHVWLEFYGRK